MKRNIMINTSIENNGKIIDGAIMVSYTDPDDPQPAMIGVVSIPTIDTGYYISIGMTFKDGRMNTIDLKDKEDLQYIITKLKFADVCNKSFSLCEDVNSSLLVDPKNQINNVDLVCINNNTKEKSLLITLNKDEIRLVSTMCSIVIDYINHY